MNNRRRKRLQDAASWISNAGEIVQEVLFDESNALDNYPENLQGTDVYEAMEQSVDQLGDVYDQIQEILGTIDEIVA